MCDLKELKENIYVLLGRKDDGSSGAEALAKIDEYERECPYDMDVYIIRYLWEMNYGSAADAKSLMEEGIRRYPLSSNMHYDLACASEACGDLIKAYKHYYIADKMSGSECKKELERTWKRLEEAGISASELEELEEGKKNIYGYLESRFRSPKADLIGRYYFDGEEKRFVGNADRLNDLEDTDLMRKGGEFLQVCEGTEIQINGEAAGYLLPVAASEKNTVHCIACENGETAYMFQLAKNNFQYLRLPGHNTNIISNHRSYYGNPIPLGHGEGRRKLVLNIFVDSLSGEMLEKDFSRLMPKTYKYFSEGMICSNAYSSGEWTLPSMASYVSGLYATEHMMCSPLREGAIPKDVKLLAEYFKEAGYYTAKLGGNWRLIPSYGHARGYDRFVYRHQFFGMQAEQSIFGAINHIESFKDTDQFLWFCIGDLHDVADMEALPTAVQTKLEPSDRDVLDKGETSVKQNYSIQKKHQYERMMSYVDMYLGMLYNYIEENYSEDEILVALISDHGMGYLVPPGDHFLSPWRTQVGMMFRGGGVPKGESGELISALDYKYIMCRLAGIDIEGQDSSGMLPQTFGGEERGFVLTESLHPGDNYRAAIFGEDFRFYFDNGVPVGNDARFRLEDVRLRLEDNDGNRLDNDDLSGRCMDIVLEHIAHLVIYT